MNSSIHQTKDNKHNSIPCSLYIVHIMLSLLRLYKNPRLGVNIFREKQVKALHQCPEHICLCLTQILSGVILEVLGEEFPEVITPEVGAAWTNLLATVYCSISAIYKELGWEKLSTSTG